jgi:hypothetical protein
MKHTKESILVRLTTYSARNQRLPSTHDTKLILIRVGIFKEQCEHCDIKTWNSKPISLHLDHIDGNPRNNMIDNLRLLCPNCHSQTATYCGKNVNKRTESNFCVECGCKLSTSWAMRCSNCYNKFYRKSKIVWPDKKALEIMLQAHNVEWVGKQLGVSGTAVRKHCKVHHIDYHSLHKTNNTHIG